MKELHMTTDENEELHKRLWRNQEEDMPCNTGRVCAKARKQEMLGIATYWVILGATLLFAAAFVRNILHFDNSLLVAGTGWALAALCFISWRLLQNGPNRMRTAEPCGQFLLRRLEAKRQDVRCVRWLALLLAPAIVVCWWGNGPALRAEAFGFGSPVMLEMLSGPIPLIVAGLIIAFVWFAFSRQARKIQFEIDKLRAELQ
jgi:hypothetical protein